MERRGQRASLHLYEHDVIVRGGAVVLGVGKQKLGKHFLLRALVDGQGVVSGHYHHFVYSAEIKE